MKYDLLVGVISLCTFSAEAGVMNENVPVQEYRDFAENLGKYKPGAENVEVFNIDGTSAGFLPFSIPDFSSAAKTGYTTLIASSYVTTVKHNGWYENTNFATGAKYSNDYLVINYNNHPTEDFSAARLNKVVTEVAPVEMVDPADVYDKRNTGRYTYFARVGAGYQYQIDSTGQHLNLLTPNTYAWKSAGTLKPSQISQNGITWINNDTSSPLDIAGSSGDSGSQILVYDNVDKKWKMYGVLTAGILVENGATHTSKTNALALQTDFINSIFAQNTDPDVTDVAASGDIHWTGTGAVGDIVQGDSVWKWHGADPDLPGQFILTIEDIIAGNVGTDVRNPSLDASKDLRFNGEGGLIVLDASINQGAGKLQFSNDYRVVSAEGAGNTWMGGGIEVDASKTVDWEVKGVAGDSLHKVGAGTLYVNATGDNLGALNVGDGTVVLAQQDDSAGHHQAFSSVTIVSGRPTVRLGGESQVASDQIFFGYRGGVLDLNGYDMSFTTINHSDAGATIINANTDDRSTLTLANTKSETFMGQLGSPENPSGMNVILNSTKSANNYSLTGGAYLNDLTVLNGGLTLAGKQTPHAGGVVFSNDWIDETYQIATLKLNQGGLLTLGEHGTLESDITLGENSTLQMHSRSTLAGNVMLSDNATLSVIAGSASDKSTVGAANAIITAALEGTGSLIKDGWGTLLMYSDNTFSGGTTVKNGDFVLEGSLTSTLTLENGTSFSGNASIADLIMKDNVVLAPYYDHDQAATDSISPATMRVNGNLSAGDNDVINLRARLNPDDLQYDRLLIDGDVISAGKPIMVSVTPDGSGIFTDSDNDGVADNQEGISLIQVGGNAGKNTFALAGEYVARGAYAYTLYAFAPGRSSADQRAVAGSGGQYWDYRLQNRMLSENDNTEPTADPIPDPDDGGTTPIPDPDDGGTTPIPDPDDGDTTPIPDPDDGDTTPIPDPDDDGVAPTPENSDSRSAVTPQVSSYLSLPSALLSYSNRLNTSFHDQALLLDDKRVNIFFQYLNGEDTYHSGQSFKDYGYDYKQKQEGWLFGGKVLQREDERQSLGLNFGLSRAELDVTPDAADGDSKTHYTAWGLSTLLVYKQTDGLLAEWELDAAKYDGTVSTDLRGGDVADINAKSFGTTLDLGYPFTFGQHQLTPLIGAGVQYLKVDDFNDVDGAHVDYDNIVRPTGHIGLRYRYDWDTLKAGKWAFIASTRLTKDFSNDGTVAIGDVHSAECSDFSTGVPGSTALLDVGLVNTFMPNVSLSVGGQYQKRLEAEGIDYWQVTTGIKISF
ncbi:MULTISPECIES: S6 family peptidase [Rahnella]|uniref:Autotransporter outer membrane beta-barrel domain-containing protein n=1 Tax=Rahnella laticis TaxID=2787622 RepID=A0ABS0EBS5_9GAMM|nr:MULTISPECIES: S6 family peptidase [Rahnella]MBF7982526.1 autotransporter outer membrane beta-barrel domain-containing protein [Rahnella laticis]MBF8002692.1 autotransporter outer membrane beta-barrel domain-containing protein [Rahnella sp. LAC-M12]